MKTISVNICICICICICMYIYVYTYIYIHVYVTRMVVSCSPYTNSDACNFSYYSRR